MIEQALADTLMKAASQQKVSKIVFMGKEHAQLPHLLPQV